MTKYFVLMATVATVAFTSLSFAENGEPTCVATGKTLSKTTITAKATDMGYNVRRVKTENRCFEVKAIAKDGSRVDLVMDPSSGKVIKTDKKS